LKTFFIRGLIFIAFGYAFLFFFYNYFLTGHDDEKYLIKKYLKNKDKIAAIAIGTSHIWGLNFKSIGLEGIALGVGGRDLTECKYILKFLLDQKNNSVKKVFISIGYFSLYQDNYSPDGTVSDTRAFMYNNIPSWKMVSHDYKNYILGKFLPFIQSDHWRIIAIKFFKKLHFKFMNINTPEEHFKDTVIEGHSKMIPLKEVEARVESQHQIHKRALKNNDYYTKAHSLEVLKEIISMLKKDNIELILFTPPYYYKYTELYNKEYIDEMKSEMKHIVDRYGVKYLDFSLDPEFIYNPNYFEDSDHINLEASKRLGEKIHSVL